MSAAYAAARMGDPIEHSSALMGFLVGAAVGLAVGAAIVAATVATGGLALVAAVGGAMALTGGVALVGERLGQTFTSQCGAIMAPCSPNVRINGRWAARAIVDAALCSKDGPPVVPIAQGSRTVRINGEPAARKGDMLVCGGKIADGSPNVRIGAAPGTYLAIKSEVPDWMNELAQGLMLAGTAVALVFGAAAAFVAGGMCALIGFGGEVLGGLVGGVVGGEVGGAIGKAVGGERGEIVGEFVGGLAGGFFGAKTGGRMTVGHPVDVATGELFTEQTDFHGNGPLPLVWSRLWISSSTTDGALGRGWHHSYDMALTYSAKTGYYLARLSDGRMAFFTPPALLEPALNTVERMMLHTDRRRFWLSDYEGVVYEFGDEAPDGLRHLVRVADANGNEIRLERNEAGRLFAIVDSPGRLYPVTNDEAGRIVAIDGPHPARDGEMLRLVTYRYNEAGDLVESQDARGGALQYAYSNHLLVEERRRGGLQFHFVWDDVARGRKARCVETWGDGELFRAKLEYDEDQHTTVVTTGRGAVSRYRWNALGLVDEEVDPLGAVTIRLYDAAGRVLTITGPDGKVVGQNVFDDFGRLVEQTNAAGETTRIEYALQDLDGVGHALPVRITGPDGAIHRFAYDLRGNLLQYIDPAGLERRYQWNGRGLVEEISDREGIWRQHRWSAAGELEWMGLEESAQVRYWHDALGRIVAMARGDDVPTRFTRDANGNVTAMRRPDGGVVELEYDAEDRVTRHRDPLGRETSWRYDGLRFPVERIAADGSRFAYRYDSELNLVGLENPKGEQYVLNYDPAGRLVREVGFDGRTLEYRLDAYGRLLEQVDAGRSTQFERDTIGRLLEKRFADGTSQRFEWDQAGRLTLAENAVRKVEFAYDAAGRLIRETQDGQALEHGYDLRGRRVESVLPDGRKLQVGYEADDLFSAVVFDGKWLARIARDTAGREVYRQTGPVRQQQTYDPQGRLMRQRGLRGESESVFVRRYTYDGSDALRQIEDARRGLKEYQYDACDRLLAVDAAEPESFVFDPAGNLIGARGRATGEARGDRLLSHDGKQFEYDEHGNRMAEESATSRGARKEYRYGPDNELIEVLERDKPDGRVTRFGYDGLGRRVWKESAKIGELMATTRAMKRTEFLWNGDVLLAESRDPKDPLAIVYVYEPGSFRPLAQVHRKQPWDTRIYHYHLDHLGTPQEMTDGEGEVVWATDLKAWGQVRVKFVGKVENPLRFQGQYCDEETGLHYNRFRYYSPGEGRFINQDPIGLFGGTNVYEYGANPIGWIDPFGLAGNPATATHVTYVGTDSATGKPYVGYASMQGVQTPEDVVSYRYSGNFDRFGGTAPDPIYSGYGQAGKDTARGLEQRTFEARGGLQGTANKENPVGVGNARRTEYLAAADEHLEKQKAATSGGCV